MKRANLPVKDSFNFSIKTTSGQGLAGRFFVPPFSVLRATEGDWQRRKRQWLALGIKSEIGRQTNSLATYVGDGGMCDRLAPRTRKPNHGKVFAIGDKKEWENKYKVNGHLDEKAQKALGCFVAYGQTTIERNQGSITGTSIFDPVLTELMYSWFCPRGGSILDPFAGGSVRGIVAHYMGFKYVGIDLRPEQIESNIEQAKEILGENNLPNWWIGDSKETIRKMPGEFDFLFSCPPYGDLEIYSELQEDLSTMTFENFIETYNVIIRRACRKLKENRFACFVVGNYRDKKTGIYRDLVGATVRAFESCGVGLYNDAIFITPTGSLPIRAGKAFEVSRKLGKTHQNILVFYKGDSKEIRNIFNV